MTESETGNSSLIAYCGLYCGECHKFKKDSCPGCAGNDKASWCAIRTCCRDGNRTSCAECTTNPDPKTCKKFHNLIGRIFGFIFRSDRAACVRRIREVGPDAFAREMAESGRQTIKR